MTVTVTVAISFDKQFETYWDTHCKQSYPAGIGEAERITVQFLIDLTEYATIYIWSPIYEDKFLIAAVGSWAIYTKSWITMHDLMKLLVFPSRLPEVDIFVNDTMIDGTAPKPVLDLVTRWHSR